MRCDFGRNRAGILLRLGCAIQMRQRKQQNCSHNCPERLTMGQQTDAESCQDRSGGPPDLP